MTYDDGGGKEIKWWLMNIVKYSRKYARFAKKINILQAKFRYTELRKNSNIKPIPT